MNRPTFVALLGVVVASLLTLGATAQHSQHHPRQDAQKEAEKMSMMSSGMMEQMMQQHQQMEKLVEQLLSSFKELQQETDPEARQSILAEHGALLKQLQSQVKHRSEMMQKMREHMKSCPMMGKEPREE